MQIDIDGQQVIYNSDDKTYSINMFLKSFKSLDALINAIGRETINNSRTALWVNPQTGELLTVQVVSCAMDRVTIKYKRKMETLFFSNLYADTAKNKKLFEEAKALQQEHDNMLRSLSRVRTKIYKLQDSMTKYTK